MGKEQSWGRRKQYEDEDKEMETEWKEPDYLGHYADLGWTTVATKGDIVASYRKLALKTHPDKQEIDNTLQSTTTIWFQRVNEEHAVLSDEEKRAKYDEACLPNAKAKDTSKAPTDKAHAEACVEIVALSGWVVRKSRSTGSCYLAQPMFEHVQWASLRLYPYVATDNCSCTKYTAAFPK